MKIPAKLYTSMVSFLAAAFLANLAGGQPAPRGQIDPATGLPAGDQGELTPMNAVGAGYQAAAEVHKLIFNHQYEDALQRCLAFHNRWKTSASLIPLLSDWVELGRRYPTAKAALVDLRDGDVREFSKGRGYFELFQEVHAINNALNQEEGTCELFKSFRDKDRALARQCFGTVEGLLVAQRDYRWCYDHMGEPQAKFDSICQRMRFLHELDARQAGLQEASRKRIAEMREQHGLTNAPGFTPPAPFMPKHSLAEEGFVGQTRQLIEILVGCGHRPEAEKICTQAVAVLDDARLKSAVTDAVERVGAK